MNVDSPRVPYDGDNSVNPLWDFAFVSNDRDELINDIKKFLKEYKVEY